MAKRLSFADQIRKAINESGQSRYAICKRMDFSESVMSKFMHGTSGLSLDTLDRLADVIGMSIVSNSKGTGRAKTRLAGRSGRQTKGR